MAADEGTTILIHDLTSDALYCDHFLVECYTDNALTNLFASGVAKVKWDGSVFQQVEGIYISGLIPGSAYYLRWGPVSPQTGLASFNGATETYTVPSVTVPTVSSYSPTYYPVSSGVKYVVTPNTPSSDIDHYESFSNLTGTSPGATQVPHDRVLGTLISSDFVFFIGGNPGDVLYTWVRAVGTSGGASAWVALANQTIPNFVGNLDNISDGSTYAKVLAADLSSGHIAKIQNHAVSASAPTAGDVLKYVSSTWTPTAPLLSDESDVVISSPADTQVLTYEASSSKWKNKPAGGGGGGGASSLVGYRRTNRMVCKQKASGGSLTQIGDVVNVLGTEFNPWEAPNTTQGQSTSYDNGAADTVAGWQGNTSLNYLLGLNLHMFAEAYLGDITDIIFTCGLLSNSSLGGTTLPAFYNTAYIRFDVTASDAVFHTVTSDGFGSQTVTATSVTPVALTSYRFLIVCDDTTPNVKFYINDVLVATHTTHLPGSTQRAIWQVSGAWHTAPGSPTIGISEVVVQSDR